jgi:transposase-like protein
VNLIDMNTMFSTDAKCREMLARLRWPEGPRCLRCKLPVVLLETDKQLFYCKECDYQFSVTAGTVFNDSHLPLTLWFAATLLICESKKGMSACQIQRTLGIGGYKTAWHLCHRIRFAMAQADKPMMDGTVELDEAYVAGKPRRGKPLPKKQVVIGIRQRGGELRYFHVKDVKAGTLAKYIKENISTDAEMIITDDFGSHSHAVRKAGFSNHGVINHTKHQYAFGKIHTNTIESSFSLLKRGIMGTWHKISAKHLASYLEEMTFRYNRRNDSDLFIDTLRHMVTAPVLTFKKLTKDAA